MRKMWVGLLIATACNGGDGAAGGVGAQGMAGKDGERGVPSRGKMDGNVGP